MPSPAAGDDPGVLLLRREAPAALAYFSFYVVYLFGRLENELLHWVSLVVLPLALIFWARRWEVTHARFAGALASVGLARGNLKSGLFGAVLVGLALSLLQLLGSRHAGRIAEVFASGQFLHLLPLSFGLMLLTAGFTEEFFFRGVLQTRLSGWLRSHWWAVIVTALLFGLYHLPYAYLNTRWPSHGDWPAAFRLAFGQGVPAGLILGWVYVRARGNLLACVLTHTMINMLPAMLQVRLG